MADANRLLADDVNTGSRSSRYYFKMSRISEAMITG